MTDPFATALAEILRREGGFVNDPRDRGGMTNLGVTKAVWEHWIGRKASEADMRALTPATVAPLYRANYWDAVAGDKLPPALALCVFDFAVNAGPGRAARYLQRLLGVGDDGDIGPMTLKSLEAFLRRNRVAEAVRLYQELRRGYYRGLADFKIYGTGWLRRVDAVESAALRLVK